MGRNERNEAIAVEHESRTNWEWGEGGGGAKPTCCVLLHNYDVVC